MNGGDGSAQRTPPLPSPRGPLSGALLDRLVSRTRTLPDDRVVRALAADPRGRDAEDVHLALHCAYELHYRGWGLGADDLEWDLDVLRFRAGLERAVMDELADAVPVEAVRDDEATRRLSDVVDGADGPSLSGYMAERGTVEELREFAIHRSIYQLREADGHTWVIPRFGGPSRSALIEIQADEYGSGRPGRSHSELFATTMRALGLDDRYGAYLDVVGAPTLATTNLLTMLALHRRWLPAVVGHLAAFEMTSVGPMSRYAAACARHGLGRSATDFYDVHVEADEHHGPLARDGLVGRFVVEHPGSASLVVWGAAALMEVERRFSTHLLDAWAAGRSSLRGTPSAEAPRVTHPVRRELAVHGR